MKRGFVANSFTVKGRSHEVNEDRFYIGKDFVIVSDGMGGENCGEVASDIAVKVISKILKKTNLQHLDAKSAEKLMTGAISEADRSINAYQDSYPEALGMGATVIVAVFSGDNLYLSWCGDSRGMIFSDGKLRMLTKDHSLVQQLVDEGKLKQEEVLTHPDNNIITRYLGGGEKYCVPEFSSIKWKKGDEVILCSDGLTGYCPADRIGASGKSAEELKELALASGSEDDITIVVVRHSSGLGFWQRLIGR